MPPSREIFNLNFLSRTRDETPFTFTRSSKLHSADQRQISLLRDARIQQNTSDWENSVRIYASNLTISDLKEFLSTNYLIHERFFLQDPNMDAGFTRSIEHLLRATITKQRFRSFILIKKILFIYMCVCVYIF